MMLEKKTELNLTGIKAIVLAALQAVSIFLPENSVQVHCSPVGVLLRHAPIHINFNVV